MSSAKDIIISKIVASMVKQRTEKVSNSIVSNPVQFFNYHFNSIKSIHDINCDVYLEFRYGVVNDGSSDFVVFLGITHTDMGDYNFGIRLITLYKEKIGRYEKFDRDTVSTILDDMKTEISKLHFNVFTGEFSNTPTTILEEIEFFQDIPNVKTIGEECPVCKVVVTSTKTECGHTLCVPCFQTIKEVNIDDDDDDDDERKIRPCPICRADMKYTN
jgi:hypothetical protein